MMYTHVQGNRSHFVISHNTGSSDLLKLNKIRYSTSNTKLAKISLLNMPCRTLLKMWCDALSMYVNSIYFYIHKMTTLTHSNASLEC